MSQRAHSRSVRALYRSERTPRPEKALPRSEKALFRPERSFSGVRGRSIGQRVSFLCLRSEV